MIKTAHLLAAFLLCAGRCAGAEAMAVIADRDGFTNVRWNNQVVGVVKSGERFVAVAKPDADWWDVYLASGISGSMHKSRIRLLPDEPVVKLAYRLKDVSQSAGAEPSEAARKHGLDYVGLVRRAASGDPDALRTLFGIGYMDGAAAELHGGILWAVFHLAGDAKFAAFLRAQPPKLRERVRDELTSANHTYPISRPKEYIRRHFPGTATLLQLKADA